MPADNKLELVVEVDVNNANASIKSINTEQVRPEAIEAKWTEEILKERGLKAPIAVVKSLPASQAPAN